MKVSIEIPDKAKKIMDELVILLKDEGVETYKDLCERVIRTYFGEYVSARNRFLIENVAKMADGEWKGETE